SFSSVAPATRRRRRKSPRRPTPPRRMTRRPTTRRLMTRRPTIRRPTTRRLRASNPRFAALRPTLEPSVGRFVFFCFERQPVYVKRLAPALLVCFLLGCGSSGDKGANKDLDRPVSADKDVKKPK